MSSRHALAALCGALMLAGCGGPTASPTPTPAPTSLGVLSLTVGTLQSVSSTPVLVETQSPIAYTIAPSSTTIVEPTLTIRVGQAVGLYSTSTSDIWLYLAGGSCPALAQDYTTSPGVYGGLPQSYVSASVLSAIAPGSCEVLDGPTDGSPTLEVPLVVVAP